MLGRARLILATAAAVVILGAVPAAAVATDPLPPPSPGPSASPEPSPVTPSGLTMAARPLLGGHARPGSWVAIAVDLANEGPPVNGELRAAAGPGRRTIFGRAVELPTNSQKREIVYVQAPSFDQQLTVSLVADDQVLARVAVEITIHDPMQLVVGIVAERPGPIAAAVRGLATGTGPAPAVATLAPADLPERVEAWSALDRLVWQDVDSSALSADQLAALRGWLSGGGRLVLLGGTGGLGAIARFPDDILPYRPTATVDAPIETLRPLFGPLPETPSTVPALAGPILRGRALASVGEDAVVGEAPYGSGSVTLLGIDPTVEPIVDLKSLSAVWARLLPPRGGGVLNIVDDSGLVSALTNLPALALPPIGGLLVLLVGYIVLIGPVNYVVLRRLDRREWAWISMPLLIVGFAVAAYGYGAALRGSDVIVNEVAIATGAAGTTEGRSQVYVGVFSPSRGTYELTLPGGPLVAAPVSELFGITGTAGALDVLQGDPARIRGLSIGFGTLRAFRADLPTAVPLVEADLRVVDGIIRGRLVNRSTIRLLAPAVVFGSSAVTLPELAPGASTSIELPLSRGAVGANLADRIVGAYPAADPAQLSDAARERIVRYQVINQLTLRPLQRLQWPLAPVGEPDPPGLGSSAPGAGRRRRTGTPPARNDPLLPEPPAPGRRHGRLRRRSPPADGRGQRERLLQPRPLELQPRPGFGHHRLPDRPHQRPTDGLPPRRRLQHRSRDRRQRADRDRAGRAGRADRPLHRDPVPGRGAGRAPGARDLRPRPGRVDGPPPPRRRPSVCHPRARALR
ncbi:MAG: hypothetical protein KatS3mg065_0769 [Chloroflexota bacterium]|nr:MAG: hypothetical protein KatS3mg065_0769 [Chloroflexota bacterium]